MACVPKGLLLRLYVFLFSSFTLLCLVVFLLCYIPTNFSFFSFFSHRSYTCCGLSYFLFCPRSMLIFASTPSTTQSLVPWGEGPEQLLKSQLIWDWRLVPSYNQDWARRHVNVHGKFMCTRSTRVHRLRRRKLIVVAASCSPTNLSHLRREASGCLPSQGRLQYLLWMGVEPSTVCQSILII